MRKTAAWFLLAASALAADRAAVPLLVTQTGAPIRLRGSLVPAPADANVAHIFVAQLQLGNASSKQIILTAIGLELRENGSLASSSTFIDDDFFGIALASSATRTLAHRVYAVLQGGPEGPDVSLTAAAAVAFVQFSDGSSWGDPTVAAVRIKEREDDIRRLRELDAVYRTKGKEEFMHELMSPSQLLAVASIQAVLRNSNMPSAAYNKLTQLLSVAERRSREMNQPN